MESKKKREAEEREQAEISRQQNLEKGHQNQDPFEEDMENILAENM